jgi:minor fimbrial subunit
MKLPVSLAAALFAGLVYAPAYAVTDTVTINVSGTLTRPPCILTSSKTLTANFGSLRYDQVDSAPVIDIPVNMICPNNSSMNVSVKASTNYQGAPTKGYAGKSGLAYTLTWNSDATDADLTGVKRVLTNQSGAVDLGMKAKLVTVGAVTEGAFSASAVISIEYL